MKRIVLIVLFLIGIQQWAGTTHIVGGELNYTCLGNGMYEVTLTVYRDCFFGNPQAQFDNPASIGFFDENNQLIPEIGQMGQLLMFVNPDDTLNPVLYDSCLVIPPDVCVHTTTYRDTMELPFRIGGYQVAYQRCCRNETIVNIINPLASGATYYVLITEEALLECNSNPKFRDWPPIYICANEPIVFDHSAFDVDGDSLVYTLCTPLLGADQTIPRPQPPNPPPYDPVVWLDPYSEDDMLGGVPLKIDPVTGLLTGTPMTVGQFVVGVCVEEYRNGELISTTRRDFQYNVGVCGRVASAFFTPEIQCGKIVSVTNESQNADTYEWIFGDFENPEFVSTDEHPVYEFNEYGSQTITLISYSNETGCSDTSSQSVFLKEETINAFFETTIDDCTDTLFLSVTDLSSDSQHGVIAWEWTLITSEYILTDTTQNPSFKIFGVTEAELILIAVSGNDCRDTFSLIFPVNTIQPGDIPDTILMCRGQFAELNPDGNPSYTYVWMPQEGIISGADSHNPVVSPENTTMYHVQMENFADCYFMDSVLVIVHDAPEVDSIWADPPIILAGEESQLETELLDNVTYQWFPVESLNDPGIHDPVATPTETTTYTVFITNEHGCTDTLSILVLVILPECIEPYIFIPNAFSPNGDGINDRFNIKGVHIDEGELLVYNRWGQKVFHSRNLESGWDGTYKGEELPPDVFGYYAKVRCIGGEEFEQSGNVTLFR